MDSFLIVTFIFLGVLMQRVVGFGMPMLTLPVLLLFFQPPQALVIVLFIGIVSSGMVLFNLRSNSKVAWRIILSILPISIVGILVGSYIITIIDKAWLQIALGLLVILSINIQEYFLPKPTKKLKPNKQMYAVGLAAGFFNPTVALSAAPLILWIRSHIVRPNQLRQIMAVSFITMNSISIFSILSFKPEILKENHLTIVILALPAIFLANLLGAKIANNLAQGIYEKTVYAILTITGILCLAIGINSL